MDNYLSTEQRRDAIAGIANLLADPQFLQDTLFTQDDSQFVGSSYRMLARATIPASMNVRETLIDHLPSDCRRCERLLQTITRYADDLPGQVKTLVDVPRNTPPEDSMVLLRKIGQLALQVSLLGHTPFAALHASLLRTMHPGSRRLTAASELVCGAVLTNYHTLYAARVHKNWPELWNAHQGELVFDSRGVFSAHQLIDELKQRGMLRSKDMLLDVGSGIGTLPFAVNRWSEASSSGIELHPGLYRAAKSYQRRLHACGAIDNERLTMHQGDFRSTPNVLAQADVLYVYSPLGTSAIQLDDVVQCMKPGAVLISERLPALRLADVEIQARVATLLTMRKK